MDFAYDHITEENLPKNDAAAQPGSPQTQQSLNAEFREAYQAVANSPWGAKLGGLWGNVMKQGGRYYEEAQKTTSAAGSQASKGLSELINRTRSMSLAQDDQNTPTEATDSKDPADTASSSSTIVHVEHPDRPESLPADIVKEAESMLSRFRSEAAKRLKDIEKAEDAADEALLRFGTNIRAFLRDAVSVRPPSEDGNEGDTQEVLFESKDAEGKRVIHTTRMDAQLHVIHCSLDSFLKDPIGKEWDDWVKDFDVEKMTDQIGKDLDKHEELRKAMEKCVPEKVDYPSFWKRYYFLRKIIQGEEEKRRALLKGAASQNLEEEVAWDEDSDDDNDNDNATPVAGSSTTTLTKPKDTSKTTDGGSLKPVESRKSNDGQSQADSDASYDVVSGATSRTPSSPKDGKLAEESDEEDWE